MRSLQFGIRLFERRISQGCRSDQALLLHGLEPEGHGIRSG